MSKRRVTSGAILAGIVQFVVSASSMDARAGEFSGAVEAGFDSFTEQYTIVEEDTLAQLNEFNTRLHLRYLTGTLFGNHFMVEGRGMFGGQSVENMARAGCLYRGTTQRLFAEASATGREYRESSAYAFPNDFVRYNARAYYQRQLTAPWSIRLTDRVEVLDFDQKTEFDYDYVLNRLILSTDVESGFTTGYQAAVGYVRKEVPDSTAIAYDAGTCALEYRRASGLHRQIFVSAQAERRVYRDKLTRSPFWSALLLANLQPIVFGSFGSGIDLAGEWYAYDRNTNAYFDYAEGRAFAFVSHFRGLNWTVRLGPVAGALTSGFSEQDEYVQLGGRLTIDYFSSDRIWVSASYEPGRRDYRYTAQTEFEQLFSDFTYHSVSLVTTLRVLPRTSLNIFANYEPQDHVVHRDDSSSALLATNIAYSF